MTQEEFFALVSVVCLAGCAALVVVGWFNGLAARRATRAAAEATEVMKSRAEDYHKREIAAQSTLVALEQASHTAKGDLTAMDEARDEIVEQIDRFEALQNKVHRALQVKS